MRKKQRKTNEARAHSLLERLDVAYLAALDPSGAMVVRALHPVVQGDWVLFHGAHAGEKSSCRGPAILTGHRTIAEIPSYFVDPELACPATTYFESVEARGQLEDIEDVALKDAMLEALMRKYQPEAGYLPIDSRTKIYAKQVRATRIFGFRIEKITGKLSAGQDRPAERVEKVIRGLFRRGAPGDLQAIEEVLSWSPAARPDFLRHSFGEFCVACTPELAAAHARLLEGAYWRKSSTPDEIARAALASSAWVGLMSAEGDLLGAARATTDKVWAGMVSDVIVHPNYRGKGIGTALMQLLLEHPAVREVKRLRLGTADQTAFYRRFGFKAPAETPLPFPSTEMVLAR